MIIGKQKNQNMFCNCETLLPNIFCIFTTASVELNDVTFHVALSNKGIYLIHLWAGSLAHIFGYFIQCQDAGL